ncbi:MAG: Eco57I restriction-modification methylase domain-containing protein, partial [Promethearchaeota archaeon]
MSLCALHRFENLNANEESVQRRLGAYYTSIELANYILEKAILKDISKRLKQDFHSFKEVLDSDEKKLKDLIQETVGLPSLKILDPSVGEGAFLLSALKILLSLREKIAKKLAIPFNKGYVAREIVNYNLFGVDIDKEAIKKCKRKLYSYIEELEKINSSLEQNIPLRLEFNIQTGNSIIGHVIRYQDFKKKIPSKLLKQLSKRNDLVKKYRQEKDEFMAKKIKEEIEKNDEKVSKFLNKAYNVEFSTFTYFHWALRFSEIIAEGGFDIVVGNPPYISYYTSKKGKQQLSVLERQFLIKTYDFISNKKNIKQRIGTMMFFLERGIHLLKENGFLFFILDTAFYVEAYEKIRAYIIKNTTILAIYEGLKSFSSVQSGQILLFIQKKVPKSYHKVEFYDSSFKFVSLTPQNRFSENNRFQFESFDPIVEKINNKINERKSVLLLGKEWQIDVGYNVGGHPDFWSEKPSEKAKPFVKGGGSIQKWQLIYPSPIQQKKKHLFLIYDPQLVQEVMKRAKKRKKGLPGFGNKEEKFAGEKIFLRQAGWELTGTIDRNGYRATHSLFLITPKHRKSEQVDQNSLSAENETNIKKFDPRIVLASLNSAVCTYYAHKRFLLLAQRGKIPQITTNAAKLLPIVIPKDVQLVCEIVETLLRVKGRQLHDKSHSEKILEEMLELIEFENFLFDHGLIQDYLSHFLLNHKGKLEKDLTSDDTVRDKTSANPGIDLI